MSAECLENAANAASKRRELRRRRLLQSPEERLKKIMGYQLPGNEPVIIHPGDRIGDAAEDEMLPKENNHAENNVDQNNKYHQRIQPPHHQENMHLNNTGDHTTSGAPGAQQISSLLGNLLADNGAIREETPPTVEHSEFQKMRQIICAVLGVLTRLSFVCSFGNEYVQTIVYPFVFFEIAIIGYQKIIGMDLGASVKGGLWLTVLVLAGIKREVVHTYKTWMGAFSSAADDFTVFFFAFVLIHIFVP